MSVGEISFLVGLVNLAQNHYLHRKKSDFTPKDALRAEDIISKLENSGISQMTENWVGPEFMVNNPLTRDDYDNLSWSAWGIDTTEMSAVELIDLWLGKANDFSQK